MSIRVRFFASIREKVGQSECVVDGKPGATAQDLWRTVTGLPVPGNVLVAVNQQYAKIETTVRDGDEVAFFPPVTGG